MDILISKMAEAELPRVMEIEQKSFPDPWSQDSFYRELKKNKRALYLTAFYADKVIAYIGAWIIVDELHITNIAVDPEFRRRGVGDCLLKGMMKRASKQGVVRATLEVRVSNKSAISLYQKNGFVPVGCRPHYYNNREDALIMWKEFYDD